ncbi:MAG: TIR domain-containing protein [Bryobacterales bacterium]|nr:TIR domain-containing protein [Bryobacterales bacterium]
MNLRIEQHAERVGADWFNWAVWLEGPESDLDQVEMVVYKLHETFPQPVRRVTDRKKKFRLETGGWGEFMIYAQARLKNGGELAMRHWLSLGGASLRGGARVEKRCVFVTSGIADEPLADAVHEALEKEGLRVVRPTDDADLPPEASVRQVLRQAHAAVMILSERPSPWLRMELKAITEQKLPVIPVVVGEHGAGLPTEVAAAMEIRVKTGQPLEVAAEEIAKRVSASTAF